ncbi:hypothetical protein MSG28_004588 [Choristoneura fumiferana]|uniref:Uncharacterized protein n=2 Tax=Choristoneura fumiferana TaxID=7141 RepID=A0ACC0K6S0_CHOFU|nr:hypothetical protein MSG28_004588 [Choristoneura fumiferana]
MFNYTTEDADPPFKWDFYHSFFFSYTVVSTIGYGNLAPTTHLSRILMIFYGLFGIPINGILLANLGEYFGIQLISVYRKYKRRNAKRANNIGYFFHNLGMLGQIFLYLIPGFLFFIFLPACIFMVFEGWDYVASVYYAFVTLTTIGFGDLVAGTINNGFANGYFIAYQIFLIFWITFGLGYIVMLLGFITSGMRSESVHRLEQKFANQFKSTQNRILQGFTRDMAVIRKIINEANVIKLKPVYVDTAPRLVRSVSCPNLTFDVEPRGPITKRRRANSENIYLSSRDILRIQSDTDLLGIDKDKTFSASAIVKPAELLARVVNVLGGFEPQQQERGIHMFNDEEILASEKLPVFSIGQDIIKSSPKRTRACSVAVPNYKKDSVPTIDHDFTWTNGDTGDKFRREANIRTGKLSLPDGRIAVSPVSETPPKSILSKIFRKTSTAEDPAEYIKNSMKGRVSIAQGVNENVNTKPRRGSIFPTFDLHEEDDQAKAYREKTRKGRRSIFPTFDFSEDTNEDEASIKKYQQRKRHSIFPTFDFSEDADEDAGRAYREKTKSGRRSIFPSFDFSDPDEDLANEYKESTRRGRRSIFPTFNFSDPNNDNNDDTIDDREVQKYQNRTKKGRLSLFPTFGKSKKNEDEDMPDNSEEVLDYQKKTSRGRLSLLPTFGKNRSERPSSSNDQPSDLEASIREYQKQTNHGRKSLFSDDAENYKKATEDGRGSLFDSELERYKQKTKRGRGSMFDPDVNLSSLPQSEQVQVLEQTSVADLLRALAVLETTAPGSSSATDSTGILELLSQPQPAATRRRGSVRPDFVLPPIPTRPEPAETTESAGPRRRRISGRGNAPQFTPTLATVMAGAELQTTATAARESRMNMLTQPPPPYSETADEPLQPKVRRYSPAPPGPGRSSGPVPRLFSRIRKESVASIEEADSRRGSLTDVVIDNNKDDT